jgi:hypothetical protein
MHTDTTTTTTIQLSQQATGQCPLRNIGLLNKEQKSRKTRKEIVLAILVDIFSNFSLKG